MTLVTACGVVLSVFFILVLFGSEDRVESLICAQKAPCKAVTPAHNPRPLRAA